MILAIYIDDLLLVKASRLKIQNIKKSLSKCFYIVNLGTTTYYLRITVTQDYTNYFFYHGQPGYFKEVFKTHRIFESKPIASPINNLLVVVAIDH